MPTDKVKNESNMGKEIKREGGMEVGSGVNGDMKVGWGDKRVGKHV